MKPYFALGLFALYVVVVSLVRLLADREIIAMKKFWGARRGLALQFVASVGLPMILGVVFLSRGVAVFPQLSEQGLLAPAHHNHFLAHLQPWVPGALTVPSDLSESGEIALLLPKKEPRRHLARTSLISIPLSP